MFADFHCTVPTMAAADDATFQLLSSLSSSWPIRCPVVHSVLLLLRTDSQTSQEATGDFTLATMAGLVLCPLPGHNSPRQYKPSS